MSRHRQAPPPRYYDRGWPYIAAIVAVLLVMLAFYLLVVL
jgi:hypothetical protein